MFDQFLDRKGLAAARRAMQENRAWERNAQRLVALLVPDQVDDVLIEKGFKIGAPRQTELAQRLLTNGNGLADPLLLPVALTSSFFGRLRQTGRAPGRARGLQ